MLYNVPWPLANQWLTSRLHRPGAEMFEIVDMKLSPYVHDHHILWPAPGPFGCSVTGMNTGCVYDSGLHILAADTRLGGLNAMKLSPELFISMFQIR
jgi:hypothetical protein